MRGSAWALHEGSINRSAWGCGPTRGLADDQPVQTAHVAAPVALEYLDLTACPSAEQQARSDALAVEQGRKSFDLERGCLMRWVLVR